MNTTVIAANEYAFIANAQTVVANIPILVTSASIFGTNGQAIVITANLFVTSLLQKYLNYSCEEDFL
ncbi:hypothetical protein [Nostoc sp.]|uniref:hypothetical protein n=1 Tax=Nostoc sp. TaxID=1180 RepID=UPI002FF93915